MNPLLISFCMSMAVMEGSWFALLQLSSQIWRSGKSASGLVLGAQIPAGSI